MLSSILYIHLPTLRKIIYLNCVRYFSFRRLLVTILLLIILLLLGSLLFVFRLLDEILFFNYRKVSIKEPVFIISNPRSGTTFLHRLMTLDEDRYNYTLLYHTVFTSVTLIKFIQLLGRLDKKIGGPLKKLVDLFESVLFSGWKNIHPTGFDQSEEDEGMYILPLLSSAVCLVCPYMDELSYLTIPDRLPERQRRRLKAYYESSMKRFAYATGKQKTILSKNVNSIGRMKTVLEVFPDAKVIYLIRDPQKAVPSFISMFSVTWKLHSPDIKEDAAPYQALGDVAIDFYNYFDEIKEELPPENLVVIGYKNLIADPIATIQQIYQKFDFPFSPQFSESLTKETQRQRNYSSKHDYSLTRYGMSELRLKERLSKIYLNYDI